MKFVTQLCPERIPQVSALWKTSFGDDDNYVNFILPVLKEKAHFYAIEENAVLVSMLFMFDMPILSGGQFIKASYMYGVATQKNFRNKGYFSALLDFALKDLSENKTEFVYCVPVRKDLFAMYRKLGFEETLTRSKKLVEFDEQNCLTHFCRVDNYDLACKIFRQVITKNGLSGAYKDNQLLNKSLESAEASLYFFDDGYFCFDGKNVCELVCQDMTRQEQISLEIARFFSRDITVVSLPDEENHQEYGVIMVLGGKKLPHLNYGNMLFD